MRYIFLFLAAIGALVSVAGFYGTEPVRAADTQAQSFDGLCRSQIATSLGSTSVFNKLELGRFPAFTSAKIASSCQCLNNLKNAQGEAAPYIEDAAFQYKFSKGVFDWRRAKESLFGLTYNTQWSDDFTPYAPGSEPIWVRVAYGKFADGMHSCAPTGWDKNIFDLVLSQHPNEQWVKSHCSCGDCGRGCAK